MKLYRFVLLLICLSFPFTALALSGNLWQQIIKEDRIIVPIKKPQIQKAIKQLLAQRNILKIIIRRATPYLFYVYQNVKAHHMPSEFALIPLVESGYSTRAISSAGAGGLWQMMPATAQQYGLTINKVYDGRFDAIESTKAALTFLDYLSDKFDHQWLLVLAAYNTGEGTIGRAVAANIASHQKTDFWSLHLYDETKTYVPKLLALSYILQHHLHYHIHLPYVPNKPYLAVAPLGRPVRFREVAKITGMSTKMVLYLNSGYKYAGTNKPGPYHITVLSGKAHKVLASTRHGDQGIRWRSYSVRAGDTLSALAVKYHTTVDYILEVNELKSTTIHVRQKILLPL